ncbi:MAG: FkbM family methyltransferase [Sedimenticola sp.]|nr:FkbM family methyltransferase [Sedimenticola sp.]
MFLYDKPKYVIRGYRYKNSLDPYEIGYIRSQLNPGDVAVDIGAHKGGYTYWMLKSVGKSGQVISVEPQPTVYKYLVQLAADLGYRNNRVFNYAVSDVIQDGYITVPGEEGRISQGARIDNQGLITGRFHQIPVRFTTVDNLIQETGVVPRLIKVDVEGHELSVFKGALDTLKRIRPIIVFECEERHLSKTSIQDVFDFFKPLNYSGYFYFEGKKYPVEEYDVDKYQTSLVRSGKKLDTSYINNFIFEPDVVAV